MATCYSPLAAAWSGTLTLRDGADTIYGRATDTSGSTAVVSITVTTNISTTAPQTLDPIANAVVASVFLLITAVVVAILLLRCRRES